MLVLAQHPAAGHHDVAPRPRRAGEDQGVEQRIARHAERCLARRVSDEQVGTRAFDETPLRMSGRSSAAGKHALEQPRRGGGLVQRIGGDVALAQRQSLTEFEQPQLFERVTADLAVGADRQRCARRQPARQIGQAVAEVGFCRRADDDAGAARRHRVDLVGSRMRGVHELPARVEPGVLCQPLDRPHAGGGQAIVDLGGLFGDVDVDRPGARAFGHARHRLRPRRPQRMDRHAARNTKALRCAL